MDYPYTLTPDKFREFYNKLLPAGTPSKVDRQYLRSLGFNSSNHYPSFAQIMKFVKLLDSSNQPSAEYKAVFRERDKGRLGALIRTAYAPLFSQFPDANRKDTEALRNFFRAATTGGERVVSATTTTFQTLASLADFEAPTGVVEPPSPPASAGGRQEGGDTRARGAQAPSGVTLHVNLQIELPATTEGEVYEKLFAAMAKHLMHLGDE